MVQEKNKYVISTGEEFGQKNNHYDGEGEKTKTRGVCLEKQKVFQGKEIRGNEEQSQKKGSKGKGTQRRKYQFVSHSGEKRVTYA